MADKEVSMVRKPEDESSSHRNPLFSIISKFTQVFNLRFPPSPPPPPAKKDVVKVERVSKGSGDAVLHGSEVAEESKLVTVRFPEARTTTVAPLKLEPEEVEQGTKPVVLWQVYAIGGFFILKWVLGRWKERRAKKKSSDEDSPPPPPAANE
ncbi:uncharacterized protein LOC112525407 [Cynara cardunculus var. scolymus]|uniref:uncharacterized protein LOC112525407 n=1 Tax=Cynara cardunculus var. scolymus TaxID=59895 RepID=UPI000D62CBCC|nr:uncharacterized protein LOC112525407 [Cynara cardunculus var. scolymus]